MVLLADLTLHALPALVFVAELCVVTLSTLRIIFIVRGKRRLAPLVGFLEVTIWLFAIGQVMQNLNDAGCFLGFAGGFTLGNYLGMLTERWLALGTVAVRAVTTRDTSNLLRELRGPLRRHEPGRPGDPRAGQGGVHRGAAARAGGRAGHAPHLRPAGVLLCG